MCYHSFAYVAQYVFLRYVWIRTQRAAVANRGTLLPPHLRFTISYTSIGNVFIIFCQTETCFFIMNALAVHEIAIEKTNCWNYWLPAGYNPLFCSLRRWSPVMSEGYVSEVGATRNWILGRNWDKSLKGAQAWKVRGRGFFTNKTCMDRWIRN